MSVNLKAKAVAVRNHVYAKRARYATLATLAVCYGVSRGAVSEWKTFLADHDLTNEYYDMGETDSIES